MFLRKQVFLCLSLLLTLLLTPAAHATDESLLIGLIPEMNIFRQKQRFQKLGEHLTRKTGIEIRFTILSRYGNIIDRFASEKMDGAFFGSFTGALAIRKLGVIPVARPVNPDNTSSYRGYLFVRSESGIKTVSDMRGKKMAFVEKATTAGYIFPLAYLRQNGVTSVDRFLGDYFFTGSHEAAIYAVLNGKTDIGAAKHSIYDRVRRKDPRIDRELTIIAASPWVPSNGLCLRKGLDPVIVGKLKKALLGLAGDPDGAPVLKKFGALRFIETTVDDYRQVFDIAEQAGIDVRRYRYRNK